MIVWNNQYWIYWKDQCKYCIKNQCEYRKRTKKYIQNLSEVSNKGCYGSLEFKCAYFILDEDLYKKENTQET